MRITECYQPVLVSVSGQVQAAPTELGGFFCTTGGQVQLREGGSGGTIKVPTFTVVAGTYYPLPFSFGGGLYAEMTSAAGTFGIAA